MQCEPYTHLLRQTRITIGRNIHNLRMKRQLPLLKLARLSQVPEHRLDHYELGKGEIRLDELIRIAFALHVKPARLLVES